MRQLRLLIATLLLVSPFAANADAILTGDTVTFEVIPGVIAPTDVLVAAGDELVFCNFLFDFDAGVTADLFSWIATPGSGSLAGSTGLILSGLDFADGSSLVGFELASTLLNDLTFSLTASSITFSWTSVGQVGPGDVLVGRYITSPVPEPGTLLLLSLGLAGIGMARRKKNV